MSRDDGLAALIGQSFEMQIHDELTGLPEWVPVQLLRHNPQTRTVTFRALWTTAEGGSLVWSTNWFWFAYHHSGDLRDAVESLDVAAGRVASPATPVSRNRRRMRDTASAERCRRRAISAPAIPSALHSTTCARRTTCPDSAARVTICSNSRRCFALSLTTIRPMPRWTRASHVDSISTAVH